MRKARRIGWLFSWLAKALLLLCVCASSALAAACVSNGTGPWATAGTWTSCGGGVPGDGDTAAIADGHVVTIAASTTVTVGADGAANTFAINLVSDDSDLIIEDNVTLNVKGSIDIDGGEFTVGAGVDIIFNTTNNQRIYIGDNYDPSVAENMFDINGTSGNRSTIQNIGTGVVNIQCRNAEDSPCRIAMDYVDVTDLGSASVDAVSSTSRNLTNFGWVRLNHVTFDGCGMINNVNNLKNGFDYTIQNVTVRNTLNANYGMRIFNSTAATTGDRILSGSVFEDTFRAEELRDFTITDTFFLGGISSIYTSQGTYTMDGIALFGGTVSETGLPYSTATDVLYFADNTSASNPHLFTGLTGQTYNQAATDWVITGNWANDEGDGWLLGTAPTTDVTLTLRGIIMPPGPSDNGIATLISQLGDANTIFDVEHSTIAVEAQPAIAVGETYSGRTGTGASFKSNLVFNLGTTGGYLIADVGTNENVSDLIASSAITHNGAFNLSGATNQLEFSSGTANANGVTTDPDFVDTTRRTVADYVDFADATTGSTVNDFIAKLARKNDSDWDTDYEIDTVLDWFRAGWTPQNSDYEAAHDSNYGGWIGAVEGSVPAAASASGPIGESMGIQAGSIKFSRTGVH